MIIRVCRWILLRMRNVSDKSFRENQNTILCSITFFSENGAVYEIMRKKYGRARQTTDDNIIRRVSFACWITKATSHTLRICNSFFFSTATVVTRTLPNVTLYVHCLFCYHCYCYSVSCLEYFILSNFLNTRVEISAVPFFTWLLAGLCRGLGLIPLSHQIPWGTK